MLSRLGLQQDSPHYITREYSMTLVSNIFFEPAPSNKVIRSVLLAMTVCLLACNIYYLVSAPRPTGRVTYGNLFISILLFLNVISFQFYFGKYVTATLRCIAIGWLVPTGLLLFGFLTPGLTSH